MVFLLLTMNDVNALEGLMLLSSLRTPRICFVLTAYSASVLSMNDNENSLSIMMMAQSKIKKVVPCALFIIKLI